MQLKLSLQVGSLSANTGVNFVPTDLSNLVAWYDASDTSTITYSTPPLVAQWNDKSGNDHHMTQGVASAQPAYFDVGGIQGLGLDLVNDNMSADFTSSGGGTFTAYMAVFYGVVKFDVIIPAGSWSLTTNPLYFPSTSLGQLVIVDGALTLEEEALLLTYMSRKGFTPRITDAPNFFSWFRTRTDLVRLYTEDWDTGEVISIASFAYGDTNLVTLDISNWTTPNLTAMFNFARDCPSLLELNASGLNVSGVAGFANFASGCPSLTDLNVSGWKPESATGAFGFISGSSSLVTLDISDWVTPNLMSCAQFAMNCTSLANFIVFGGTGTPFADSPCTNYTNAFTNTNLTQQSIDDILVAINMAGTSNGTFNQSGGSAPSSVGEAAITALRSRGWTITVTGGF